MLVKCDDCEAQNCKVLALESHNHRQMLLGMTWHDGVYSDKPAVTIIP